MLVVVADSPATFPYRLIRAPQIPPAATLYWPPPTLSHPTTIQVTNDNRRFDLDPDKDYVIQMPSTPVTTDGGVWIVGDGTSSWSAARSSTTRRSPTVETDLGTVST